MSTNRRARRRVSVLALIATFVMTLLSAVPVAANTTGTGLVISQVYGGGGNAGAQYTNDFIEIFNPTSATVSVTGWSVQYTSAAGTGNFAATPITGSLLPGHYFLVQEAAGGTPSVSLPTPDATGTLNMSGTAGKVILANTATGLACNGGSTPCSAAQLAQIVDLVGYGTGAGGTTAANFFEGAGPAPTLSNTTAASRAGGGCTDTDNNSADFTAGAPSPRNSSSSANSCAASTDPTGVGAASPSTVATGGSTLLTVAVTPGTNPTSTGLAVTGDLSAIGGSATQPFFDDATNGDVTSGDNTFSFQATVALATAPGAKSLPATITDAQARSGSASIGLTVTATTPTPGTVVVSEVYGGGGNSGATLKNDFIELYNRTGSPIDLTGWSVQYASSAGTTWLVTPLSGMIAAGRNYLIQEAAGTGGTTPLPTPDAIGTIAMSSTAGKVALVSTTTALTGSCPTGAMIIDFVGYGTTANCFEGGGPAPAPSNTTSDLRNGGGATDTDNNAADFTAGVPDPHGVEKAPTVIATTPANNASGVALAANVSITFSEPVDVTGSWFTISCGSSGVHTATVSGGATTYSLDPDSDFVPGESCTVTVLAANVTDQDTDDPPGNMAADYVFSFETADILVCGAPANFIHDIQGNGLASPIAGSSVTIEGVVVGDFQGAGQLSGFYLQEEDAQADADPATSEGIFVFGSTLPDVSVGDVVRAKGTVAEFNGLTELTSVSPMAVCSTGNALPTATDVTLPVNTLDDFERYENMRVRLPQSLVISEYFNYDQFGEIVLALPLAGETRPFTPTAIDPPGAPAQARALANSLRRITLDDGLSISNPDVLRHPNGNAFSTANLFRGGDLVQNTEGVLTFGFGLYRIEPTAAAAYTSVNPRPVAPEPVGGDLRVAAMNTLNFFLTLDYPSGDPLDNKCGPSKNVECRGADADQPLEFDRQRTKLLAAIEGLDGDVVGLNELENTTGVDPLADPTGVVPGLNAALGAGTYASITTGVIGTDAIRVGLIYKPAKVTPVGPFALLTSAVDPRFIDTRSRPALAQTFAVNATGARFTIVVNHLKSKGSACAGDPDTGDGQGNCNLTRTAAAEALVDWIATDPTGSGDPDFLIMGDLNSYAMEDPITAIKAGSDDTPGTADDFTNLIATFQGPYAYSYTFDGQAGYLDHALASASILAQVTGAADWHIDSDEADVIDYDTTFKGPGQEALYESNAYRASDHDPVVVGLNLTNGARGTIEAVLAQINALSVGAGKPDDGKLNKAAEALTKALDPNLWVDPMHVVPKDGARVFDRLKDAVKSLRDIIKDHHGAISDATVQGMIDDLVGAAAMLARTAVDDAIAAGAPADKVARAMDELAKADAAAARGDAPGAINHYKAAWQRAQDAMR